MTIASLAIAEKRLVWEPPDQGQVDGYMIYYTDGADHWSYDAGEALEVPLSDLNLTPGGVYTFWVTAYNAAGESDKSNIVNWDTPIYRPDPRPKPVSIIIPGPITITIGD